MRSGTRWYAGAAIVLSSVIAVACSDAAPTAPDTPIPAFQIAACGEWSCSIADCTNDPAIYGACCVAAADDGQPAAEKPDCELPPHEDPGCVWGAGCAGPYYDPDVDGDGSPDAGRYFFCSGFYVAAC